MEKKTKEQVWHEVNDAVDKGNLEILREEMVRVDDVISEGKAIIQLLDKDSILLKLSKDEKQAVKCVIKGLIDELSQSKED